MTLDAPQLDYAPRAPIRRRRRLRRVMGLLLVAGMVLTGWWFRAPVWGRAKLLYYQRQCLNYSAPPEQVVYDENNGTVSPLMGRAGYQGLAGDSFYHADIQGVSPAATVAVRPAPEFENYITAMGFPVSYSPATVFLHELRTKSGRVRLVAVMRGPTEPGPGAHDFCLEPVVITPAGLMSQPVVLPVLVGGGSSFWPLNRADTQNLRFYAGQVDLADSAHFTIKYDLRNGSGMIDGRLNEDGATVSIMIVSGPAMGSRWVADGGRH